MTLSGTAAAILAGGKATRMGGRPKAFLEVEGRRIVDRQLEVLRPLFSEILVGANDPAPYAELGLPVIPDPVRDQGPLAGILAVIEAASAPRIVVVACDMPYLTAASLAMIAAPEVDADVVVPVVGGRPEPLFARYSRACAAPIRARLASGERKIARFFDDVRVVTLEEPALRSVDAALRFLANCNTPEDLQTV
jgi:molybdopterin-guanine dinucleotide biosynthesis protein A